MPQQEILHDGMPSIPKRHALRMFETTMPESFGGALVIQRLPTLLMQNGTKKVMMSLCWALKEEETPEMRQVFFSLPGSEQQGQCAEQIDAIGKQ